MTKKVVVVLVLGMKRWRKTSHHAIVFEREKTQRIKIGKRPHDR